MANFTAADVKKLRDLTGAGMMDCKKALDETDGDFDKAVEELRVKGAAKAAKRGAEREATAGLVATSGGALVELKSETDFVAKNEEFITAAQRIADAANEAQAGDLESLKAVELDGKTVGEVVANLAVTIGEKIELGEVAYFDGKLGGLHAQARQRPAAGRRRARGVRRRRRGGARRGDADRRDEARSTSPATRSPSDVVEAERGVLEKKTREEGKPEAAVAKIVEGRLNGFFKEIVLLEQESVTDAKKTVKQVLDEAGVTVKRFARFEVGA